ncbi:flap endonuclease GEN-like 1 isoform X1 [Nicotiana tabacum]|uniref:flap endonuclease GEN-like 1 isoform X1 n=1 Tax=Nicotiana tabacum TaxID=4097 RepID=UPI003F4F3095
MGVVGNFWELLKPYGRAEGFDFLRNKRVAVDLSYWIVQQETAVLKAHIRNPHIRLTFFRTINLFSKFGAFPVFVADGTASPLKSQARIARFFRASGIKLSSLPAAEEGISIERNKAFQKCEQECVELLELLGVPVLKAKGEAEALCAQLNQEGQVDACITADSDAFLFGAKCVIKNIQPNSKEPLEFYHMSDIESGLGLRRNHLIAISLLVGDDHNLIGVPGIGLETALRFVKSFSEDEILSRLQEIGRGDVQVLQRDVNLDCNYIPGSDESPWKTKVQHCSFCGHPGSKKAHHKFACQDCSSTANEGCIQKPSGFKCNCSSCDLDNKEKEQKRNENWQIKVCRMIASEQNFPNNEITEMYLNKHQQSADGDYHLTWSSPKTDMLVDYLAYYQHWEPSYTRQRMLPMLSTIFLRDVASNSKDQLLCGQYEFDSIQRVKTRFGHQLYVINWKKTTREMSNEICIPSENPDMEQELRIADDGSKDLLDEPEVLQIHIKDGCSFLSTEEDMELVQSAFPEKVSQFLRDKELKETKSSRKRSVKPENSESPRGVQLSITNFYRSSKVQATPGENESRSSKISADTSGERDKEPIRNYSKSARRKLLFG